MDSEQVAPGKVLVGTLGWHHAERKVVAIHPCEAFCKVDWCFQQVPEVAGPLLVLPP